MTNPRSPSSSEADRFPPDADEDGPGASAGSAVAVGALVLALVIALAVVALALATDDGERGGGGAGIGAAPPVPTVSAPSTTDPGPSDDADGPAPAEPGSSFVGLTEAEVRERVPLVRVVERDGEPLPTTMELLPGRVNLAVDGTEVVGADVEGCDDDIGPRPDWVDRVCDPSAESGPDSAGTLVRGGDGSTLALSVATGADLYYEGLAVVPGLTADATVRDMDGAPVPTDGLTPGTSVRIWIEGPCAESSPVQCDVAAVVVDG